MGRPSKLTDAQWEAIGKRLLAGESTSALARELGVSKDAVSSRFSKRTETIKAVANQLVATDRAMANLNVSEQMAARSLADDLKAVSEHLASAARYGSALERIGLSAVCLTATGAACRIAVAGWASAGDATLTTSAAFYVAAVTIKHIREPKQ